MEAEGETGRERDQREKEGEWGKRGGLRQI